MSDNTKISWSDATWNPVSGCTEVSPGCAHCYAKTFAERFRGLEGHYYENGFDVQLRPNMLERPLTWKKPRRVFVNSMSDLFHLDVGFDYVGKVFDVMERCPQHTFQILTKRLQSALDYLTFDATLKGSFVLPNVIIGPTIENQHFADERLPVLAKIKALGWRTMVSYEPALTDVHFDAMWVTCPTCNGSMSVPVAGGGTACPTCYYPAGQGSVPVVDWLICGGESGPDRRPFNHDWARHALSQARGANIPFFMKQDGAFRSEVYDTLPDDLKVREFPR